MTIALPTHLIETVNMKAVQYLLTVLDADMWIQSYSADEDLERRMSLERTLKYLKAIVKNGGKFKTTYKKSIYDIKGLFRSYGDGIQGMPSAIRGLLCNGLMTDIDVVNCFPNILMNICEKNEIPCPNLKYYCENRQKLIDEKKVNSKTDVMICINTSEPFKTTSKYLMTLDAEIKVIQKMLIANDTYHIKDNMKAKIKNFNGTFMTNLLMYFEAKILECAYSFLIKNKYEVSAFMFDGLMVYGDFDCCEELGMFVCKELGMNHISFTTKSHSQQLKIPDDFKSDNESEIYKNLKAEYEKVYKLSFIKNIVQYAYKDDGVIGFYDKYSTSQILNTVKVGKNKFFDLWLEDEERQTYSKVDIIPNDRECPENVFNLWTGFSVCRLADAESVDIEPILNHLKIQVNHNEKAYEFMLDWLANFFQFPSSQSPLVAISTENGGTGKSSLLQLLANMVGADKFYECNNVRDKLFSSFNGHMRGVSLCNINEPSAKDLNPHYEELKTLIDSKTITIHEKGKERITISNITKYFGTSNNLHSFKIKEGDRRIFHIEGSEELRGNTEYFNNFFELIEDKNYQKSFYDFLMKRQVKKILSHVDFPQTELMNEAVYLSRDPIEDFADDLNFGEYTGDEVYLSYRQFIERSGLEFKATKKQFEMKFGRLLAKYNIIKKQIDRLENDENGNKKRVRYFVFTKS